MRSLRPIVIYISVVFIGAALIAPWLYWSVHQVAPASNFARSPFHRYVNRALLILAIGGTWPLLHTLGINSWRKMGLKKDAGIKKRLGLGFLLGFGTLGFATAMEFAFHARALASEKTVSQIFMKGLSALLTAGCVAFIEELFFRGAIFGALKKIWNWPVALVASSMIYAIVHFLARAEVSGPITWHSGFDLLPQMLRGFTDLSAILPGFINLTVAGLILGWVYQKSEVLYFSIGLHAGWIFWLKFYGFLTISTGKASSPFWGSDKLIDGWLTFLILTITLLFTVIFLPKSERFE